MEEAERLDPGGVGLPRRVQLLLMAGKRAHKMRASAHPSCARTSRFAARARASRHRPSSRNKCMESHPAATWNGEAPRACPPSSGRGTPRGSGRQRPISSTRSPCSFMTAGCPCWTVLATTPAVATSGNRWLPGLIAAGASLEGFGASCGGSSPTRRQLCTPRRVTGTAGT